MSTRSERIEGEIAMRAESLTSKLNSLQSAYLKEANTLLEKLYAGNVTLRPVELLNAYNSARGNTGLPPLDTFTCTIWLFSRRDYDKHRMHQFRIQRELTTRGRYRHENMQLDLIDMGRNNVPRYMTLIYDGCDKSLYLVTSIDISEVAGDLDRGYFGAYNRKVEMDSVIAKWKHKSNQPQRAGFVNVRTPDDNAPVDGSRVSRPYPTGVFTGPEFRAIMKKYKIHHWYYDVNHPLHLHLYKLSPELKAIVKKRPHDWKTRAHRAIAEYNGSVPTSPYISEIDTDSAAEMLELNEGDDEKLVRAPED